MIELAFTWIILLIDLSSPLPIFTLLGAGGGHFAESKLDNVTCLLPFLQCFQDRVLISAADAA